MQIYIKNEKKLSFLKHGNLIFLMLLLYSICYIESIFVLKLSYLGYIVKVFFILGQISITILTDSKNNIFVAF